MTMMELSVFGAICYCLALSIAFVGSLYALKKEIRRLHRDDIRQIQSRIKSTLIVSLLSVLATGYLFGFSEIEFNPQRTMSSAIRILIHILLLYAGPLLQRVIWVMEYLHRNNSRVSISSFLSVYQQRHMLPLFNIHNRWQSIRNFIVAPLTEEIVFRGAMIPALQAANIRNSGIPIVAPLFFGVAHVHHAVQSLTRGVSFRLVLLSGFCQFAYTSLFGAYVSFVYLNTGSILGIILGHSLCNMLGLPDFEFLQPNSVLHPWRGVLGATYVGGLSLFVFECVRPTFLLQS